MENKYGIDEARSRIYVTTDKQRGALKTLADNEGYEKFVIPDNVGGRYSVLTAVGLLPIATAGIDIDKLMQGAQNAQERYNDPNLKYNECYKYAVIRNTLYKLYKNTEILVNYEPKMHYFTESPNIIVNIEKLDEENIGELIYFFEKACAMSGMILGVNPFNQPGVEEYKKNMFKLLEKPGY